MVKKGLIHQNDGKRHHMSAGHVLLKQPPAYVARYVGAAAYYPQKKKKEKKT